ncbi:TPA: VanA-type vancomycin resistance histidine kinase VanS, partial [Enterococcus faecium]|nr:VanA-type vancomycin resistance histidine kinase VanS [Enterococcus faecium]
MVIKLKNKKNDYSKLERKLYMYIVAIVVVAIVFVLYIRSMIRGKLGDWILSILENKYDLNHLDAMKLYGSLSIRTDELCK